MDRETDKDSSVVVTPFIRGRVARLVASAIIGGAIGFFSLREGLFTDLPVPPGWPAMGLGLIGAFLAALILGLRGVWPLYAAALLGLAIAVLVLSPPIWVYPLVLALLVGVFWNARGERVPLYLTNTTTAKTLVDLTPAAATHAVDLGSGLGGTVRQLAKDRKALTVHGVETAPIPYMVSKILGFILGPKNAQIIYLDMWQVDLSQYDLVYCFLSTEPMDRLLAKAKAEMQPGSVLISNSFTSVTHPADQEHICEDQRQSRLYVWNF